MKRRFSFSFLARSSFVLSSLCCHVALFSTDSLVNSPADTNTSGTLRYAINQLDPVVGGTITFDPILNGQMIILTSPFAPLSGANIVINPPATGPFVTIDGGGLYTPLMAYSGNINIGNLIIQHAASVGGVGGTAPGANVNNGPGVMSAPGGGGGGLGAGAGLFVNSGVTAWLENVAFYFNTALGGTGGAVIFSTDSGMSRPLPAAGGGGGGAFYGGNAAGGIGAQDNGVLGSPLIGGGGGGGGGSSPGAPGGLAMFYTDPSSYCIAMTGGLGGRGGGAQGGVGGAGIEANECTKVYIPPTPGQRGAGPFGGGGGGGGGVTQPPWDFHPEPFGGASGGNGADFAGGGGAGGGAISSLAGGCGGFGGGGGGQGDYGTDYPLSLPGGLGGFGGGGGGGGPIGATSVYAGGTGGYFNSSVLNCGGGGGAGLGGAVFVRTGGRLTLSYTNPIVGYTAISGNTAIGGTGGGSITPGVAAGAGGAYGQDLFLSSGCELSFYLDYPLTISSAIDSDPLYAGQSELTVGGSNVLTLLGNNTFDGKVKVGNGAQLAVQSSANLGLTASGTAALFLDGGTLQIMNSGFVLDRFLYLGDKGGVLSITGGATAAFPSLIAPDPASTYQNGGLTIVGGVGGATAIFSGTCTYGGTTTVMPSASLQVWGNQALAPFGSIVLAEGELDLASFMGTLPNLIQGTGTVAVEAGAYPVLMGYTYGGTTTIASGATLGVGAPCASPSVVTDNGALVFQNTSGKASFGPISGPGIVVMDGVGGKASLTATDSYSGGTFFNNGTIEIHAASALGSGELTFNGGTLRLLSPYGGTLGMTAHFRSGGGTILMDSYANALATGNFDGIGAFTCTGAGNFTLSGTGTYSGNTNIGPWATLTLLSNTALTAGSVVVDQGLLQLEFPSGTVANSITGNGGVSLWGDVTYQGANKTYRGRTTIHPGATLTIPSSVAYPVNSFIEDNGLLLFDFSSPNQTLTVSQSIGGIGALTLDEGTVILSGINTYDGITTIAPGATLAVAASAGIPPGGPIVDNGALIFQNPSGDALPGTISGLGTVTMNGAGSVALTATNTYSGGTFFNNGYVKINTASALGSGALTFNSGTLKLLNPFTGPINLTATLLAGGGTIYVDSGATALDQGVITGVGPFTCTGPGKLTLHASNNYTNTTTVGASMTLELLSLASLGSGNVIDNGNLAFKLGAGSFTISQLISGPGDVAFLGSGVGSSTFQMGNASNSYSGGTIISAGVLRVSSTPITQLFSALGSGPVLMDNSGVLELLAGSYIDPRTLISGPAEGVIQLDPGVTFTSGCVILGYDPLSIVGPGQMIYSGDSVLTALLTLGNGSLGNGRLTLAGATLSGPVRVSQYAVLEGNGAVGTLTNNGTLSLSASDTLVVTGDYAQAAAALFQVQVQPDGSCSKLNVSQTAFLNGTLQVTAAPGAYPFGMAFPVLTAGNALTTSFSSMDYPSFLTPVYIRDPQLIFYVFSPSILDSGHVHDHNPQQVFHNLQEIIFTPSPDLITVVGVMNGLSSEELTEAVDQMHPAQFGAFDLLNASTSSQLTSIVTRHAAESCCQNLGQNCGCTNTSLWIQPFGRLYTQEKIGEQLGFHSMAGGLVGGMNFCSMSGVLLGLGSAYSTTPVTWSNDRGDGSMDKVSVAFYGDYRDELLFVETSVIGSLDAFTASRHIHFSTIDRHARHQRRGYDWTGHFGCGRDLQLKPVFFCPFMNLDYLYLYQKAFTESGAESLDLRVSGRHSSLLRSEAGLSVATSFHMGKRGCFAPKVWISGINECELIEQQYKAHFVDEIPSFEVRTFNKPIYLLSPGAELSFMFDSGVSLALRYSAELNGQITSQKLDGRFEWFF